MHLKEDAKEEAMKMAASRGLADVVRHLLTVGEMSTEVVLGTFGETALTLAAENGQLDCVKLLVESGSRLEKRCKTWRK